MAKVLPLLIKCQNVINIFFNSKGLLNFAD